MGRKAGVCAGVSWLPFLRESKQENLQRGSVCLGINYKEEGILTKRGRLEQGALGVEIIFVITDQSKHLGVREQKALCRQRA